MLFVGARIAGASLAIHLRRAGLSVALIDRATFPSDTPSTHIFQAEGCRCLDRLAVLDRVLDADAPWVERLDMFFQGHHVSELWPTLPTDPGPALCVRRSVLDSALVEAAESAGANLYSATRVVDVLRDDRTGRAITGGVDTHLDVHVAAALDPNGSVLGVESFTTDTTDFRELWAWLLEFGPVERVGVEGTVRRPTSPASLRSAGAEVIEVDRPSRQARRRTGKSDPGDAVEAARAALSGRARGIAKSAAASSRPCGPCWWPSARGATPASPRSTRSATWASPPR